MAAVPVDPLPIPPTVRQEDGVEVLRAFVVNSKLEVSLRRTFEESEVWGVLSADVAHHAAHVFATEMQMTEEQVLANIRAMFDAEMDEPTERGSTSAIS